MARGLWKTLEAFAESNPPAAVMAAWRHHAGSEFGTMETFLRATSQQAQLYPCLSESGCGDPHEVVSLDDGRWLARSQEDMRYCPTIWLTEAELAVHELDTERMADELCRVLEFEPAAGMGASEAAPKLWPVGTHTETRSPVYLALCPNEGQLLLNLQGLMTVCGEPFIVLAPTARHRSELVGAMLHRERCAFISLASCLAPNGAGFRVTGSIRPILDRFAAGLVATAAATGGSKPVKKSKTPDVPVRGTEGRLRWDNDFNDVYVDGIHYELTTREGARYCIRYLVMMQAFDKARAQHIERDINKYVIEQAKREVIKPGTDGNLRIQRYFNGPGNYPRLCKALVRAVGRNRCFFLQV